MKTHYDYIVLGCGGIGAGALYWLARRAGTEVLGLEQFALFHPNGGSQDHSRIIRLSYHREDYARLAFAAYAAWAHEKPPPLYRTNDDRAVACYLHKTALPTDGQAMAELLAT